MSDRPYQVVAICAECGREIPAHECDEPEDEE